MSIRIGIMGFGRIGRNVFRILYPRDDIEIVAIADVADPKALEYLLKFDTVHGRFQEPVWVTDGAMYAKGGRSACSSARRRATWTGGHGRGHRDRGHRAVPAGASSWRSTSRWGPSA
jgi:glyceraldehyde-3-phosphate dehydrogenase/erythrose-4-phosphate dehydrogenase